MAHTTPTSFGEGRYVVERMLGEGGMGSVWLARDSRFGSRLVAIKQLQAVGPTAVAAGVDRRFRREAQLLARLRHPNLVEVYDVELGTPHPFIVEEYVEGEDLGSHLARRGPMDPDAVRRLLAEQGDALAYLHAQGVVHRDVKPGNILLDREGRSRLADLGLAFDSNATRLTEEGTLLGTLSHLAPEVIRGEDHTPSSDVFGLGLVLHEAATGRSIMPLIRDTQAYLARIMTETLVRPDPDATLPHDLYTVIDRCSRLDPGERPRDGAAVLALADPHRREDTLALGPVSGARRPPRLRPSAAPAAPGPGSRRLLPIAVLGLVLASLGLLRGRRPAAPLPSPPPLAAPSDPASPVVRRGADLTEIVLPGPDTRPATLRLERPDGELLLQRTVKEGRLLMRIPRDLAGKDLRWTVTTPGGVVEGRTASGVALAFDPAGAVPSVDILQQEPCSRPVVLGDRLILTLLPDRMVVLRPDRASEAPSRLGVVQTLGLPVRDEALGFAVDGPGRMAHPLAGLGALGRDRLVVFDRARPSGTRVMRDAMDGSLEAGPTSTWPGECVMDAMTTPCPGGSLAAVVDSRPVTDGVVGERRLIIGTLSAAEPTTAAVVVLPGSVPLALTALDEDTLVVVHETPEREAAALLLARKGTAFAVGCATTLRLAGPGWHPGVGASVAVLTQRRRALLADREGLHVLEADVPPRLIRLPLGPDCIPAAVIPLSGGRVLVVVVRPLVEGMRIPVSLEAYEVDSDPGAPPPGRPHPLVSVPDNLSHVLPVPWLRTGGRILLFVSHVLLEVDDRPPFRILRERPMPGTFPKAAVLVDGMICLVDRHGLVFAYDPVEEDE